MDERNGGGGGEEGKGKVNFVAVMLKLIMIAMTDADPEGHPNMIRHIIHPVDFYCLVH